MATVPRSIAPDPPPVTVHLESRSARFGMFASMNDAHVAAYGFLR